CRLPRLRPREILPGSLSTCRHPDSEPAGKDQVVADAVVGTTSTSSPILLERTGRRGSRPYPPPLITPGPLSPPPWCFTHARRVWLNPRQCPPPSNASSRPSCSPTWSVTARWRINGSGLHFSTGRHFPHRFGRATLCFPSFRAPALASAMVMGEHERRM